MTIENQVLTPGGAPATISGTLISAALGGAVIGSGSHVETVLFEVWTTQAAVTALFPQQSAHAVLIDGKVHKLEKNGDLMLDGQTLQLNGPVATISGSTFSLAPSALVLATEGANGRPSSTIIPILPVTANAAQPTTNLRKPQSPNVKNNDNGESAINLFGTRYTSNTYGAYIIASQTLSPGGTAITISGTTVSIAPDGLHVGTNFYPIFTQYPSSASALPSATFATITSPLQLGNHNKGYQTFTGAGQIFTVPIDQLSSSSATDLPIIEVLGATITRGAPAQTISGEPISFGFETSGTRSGIQVVVVGSSTINVPATITMLDNLPAGTRSASGGPQASKVVGNPWSSDGSSSRLGYHQRKWRREYMIFGMIVGMVWAGFG